ncbi:MAG: SDR family oxidoreductase [Marinifilaceae bacterium]
MDKNFSTISILGCGWLGLPLAKYLVKQHFTVKGSTLQIEKLNQLKQAGIAPYRIELSPEINIDFNAEFFDSDILIVNFPPKRRNDIEEFHPKQIETLINQIHQSKIQKVLFVSSTSVYPNLNREVTEKDVLPAEKGSGKALQIAEQMLMKEQKFETTIIRFGGLIGYDRQPGRFLAGRKQLKDGFAPVNLIHQDDCIGIIATIIKGNHWGKIYNACCPEHPTRKEFYEKAAQIGGFELPEFNQDKQNFKIVSSEKLTLETGYQFKYRNPTNTL